MSYKTMILSFSIRLFGNIVVWLFTFLVACSIVAFFLIAASSVVWKSDVKIILKTFWNDLFVQVFTHFVLEFECLDVVVLGLGLGFVFLFVWVDLDFFEKVKEWWLFDLFSLGSTFLSFLFDDLDGDVLACFPVDLVSVSFLDFGVFDIEVFADLFVWEPFVLREIECNCELCQVSTLFSLNLE